MVAFFPTFGHFVLGVLGVARNRCHHRLKFLSDYTAYCKRQIMLFEKDLVQSCFELENLIH